MNRRLWICFGIVVLVYLIGILLMKWDTRRMEKKQAKEVGKRG